MKTISATLLATATFALLVTLAPGPLHAQRAGYSVSDLEALIAGGVSADNVLERANRGCLNFRVSAESDARLKRAGASNVLISALHSSCRTGAARITPDAPLPKPVVKHDTVIVRAPVKHDTVPREVVRPDPVVPLATYMAHDFTTDRTAPVRSDSICTRSYGWNAYVLSMVGAASPCEAFWHVWVPAAVRITATFVNVGGTSENYAWGVDFGLDTTVWSKYVLLINTVGEFSVQHQANSHWTQLLPYAKNPAVSTGVGATNTLRVDVRGHSLVFYINDQPVGRYEADAPVQGHVGVGIFAPKVGATLRVHSLGVVQIE